MQVGQEMIEIHEFKPGRRSRAIIESWKIVKTLGERKDWWCWQVWQAHVWFACLVCIKHSCLGLSGWEPRTEYVAIFSFVSFSFWFVWFVLMNLAASQIVTIVWWFVCWDFPWFLWDSIMFHNPQGYPSKQVRQKSLQTCQSPNLPREEFLQKNFFALRAPPGDMRAWGANNKGPSGGPAQVRTTGLLFFFFSRVFGWVWWCFGFCWWRRQCNPSWELLSNSFPKQQHIFFRLMLSKKSPGLRVSEFRVNVSWQISWVISPWCVDGTFCWITTSRHRGSLRSLQILWWHSRHTWMSWSAGSMRISTEV